MLDYNWDFSFLLSYREAFTKGVWVTLYISILSFILGTLIGVIYGVLLKRVPIGGVLLVINDALRAIPVLVMIFFVYYFPFKQIFGLSPPSAVWSSIIAMSITQAAYTADLVRSAIENVSKKTISAAQAVGLKDVTIFRYIILPDIIRQTLPAQMAFFIGIVRLSSLASVIGADDVVFVARTAISQNFRSLEAWVVVALLYIVIVLPLTYLARMIENSEWLKRRW